MNKEAAQVTALILIVSILFTGVIIIIGELIVKYPYTAIPIVTCLFIYALYKGIESDMKRKL